MKCFNLFITALILLLLSMKALALDCTIATGEELRDPPTLNAENHYLHTSLTAKTVDKCIHGKTVSMMSYIDANLPTDNRPVGPAYIFHVDPDQPDPVFAVNFENALGTCSETPCDCSHDGVDVKLCTNLHTHGWHVSPAGNSDNVLLNFEPGDTFNYLYAIPNNHPPGTHWLHAHLHGSTAPQLYEGMAGALILKGKTDSWLESQGITDKIMILQQLSLDSGTTSLCGDTTTSINGQCLPTLSAKEGEILRLRLIHAGISASVYFSIQNSLGKTIPLYEFARDGINLGSLETQTDIELQPGYRSDVLVKIPTNACQGKASCTLNILDDDSVANKSLYGVAEPQNLIATVTVSASNLDMSLPDADDSHFAKPYPEIRDDELVDDVEKVYFANISAGAPGNENGTSTIYTVNGDVYPAGDPISLTLGQAQKWKVWVGDAQSSSANHPFHIHVNPFEVIIRDSDGNITDRYWKDTYLISASNNKGEANAVELRSRYEDFIGDFVLHCHNLNHEDQGMMKRVQMSYPTASPHSH